MSNLLPFYSIYHFGRKSTPFTYLSLRKGSEVPLTHTYFRTLHPLSEPLYNITGEYQALFIYSVQVVKPEKGTPFGRSLPHIGQYREYPRDSLCLSEYMQSIYCFRKKNIGDLLQRIH